MKSMTEEQYKLENLRTRLQIISLMGVLLTCAIFVVVWFLVLPELPIYIPLLFVALSLGLWTIVVRPQIQGFAREKKKR